VAEERGGGVIDEEWCEIWDGFYEVSSLGNMRRAKPGISTFVGRPIKPVASATGYAMVALCSREPGRRQPTRYLHRLVIEAFRGPCPDGHVVNHIDGNKQNNALSNLEYVTHQENSRHALANLPRFRGPKKEKMPLKGQQTGDRHWSKRMPERVARGERMGASKLTEASVAQIKIRLAAGEQQKSLALEFGVSIAQLSRIARGKRWAHVEVAK
jgi:hypothetical protein